MSFDADLSACAALVERGDPWRFRCAMAAPLPARRKLFTLYALNVEVARAPWVTQESMIAEMRLQWWRDALEEIAKGGPVRKHEVVTPLAALLSTDDAAMLDQLVAARRWDIYRDPFEDEAHLDAYLNETAGHLMVAATHLLGQAEESVVRDLAWAGGVAQFLRAIPQLEGLGRVPLVDGRPEAVRALAGKGLMRLDRARRNRRGISRAALPALLPAAGARHILAAVRKDPARVGEGRLPEPGSRGSLALQALTGRY